MIIGADIFHERRYSSIVSVCASMNKDLTDYYTTNDVIKREKEYIMLTVAKLVVDCVKKYCQKNKNSPDNIIFYRDGIGMGQYDEVRKYEIASIVQTLKEEYGDSAPKLAYIVVTKRINDRFFTQGHRGLSNPEGGLIINSSVTSPTIFDFYMVA